MKTENNYKDEVWKEYTEDIFRDKDVFLISNYGRVIRKKDYDMVVNERDGYQVKIKKSILNGYPIFSAKGKKDGKHISRYVHKVAGQLFVKKKDGDIYVTHKDYDKTNNRADNLMWVDRKALNEHNKNNPNYKNGFMRRKARNAKLSVKRVLKLREIVDDPNRTMTYREIARKFRITEMQVWRIKNRKNWKGLDED